MANLEDTGNPNFFTTFKGRYSLVAAPGVTTSSTTVMLSCVNDVQVIGDFVLTNYAAGDLFATLPTECAPGNLVKIPVVVTGDTPVVDILTIGIDGAMFLLNNYATGMVHLSGVNFNISDKWYKEVTQ